MFTCETRIAPLRMSFYLNANQPSTLDIASRIFTRAQLLSNLSIKIQRAKINPPNVSIVNNCIIANVISCCTNWLGYYGNMHTRWVFQADSRDAREKRKSMGRIRVELSKCCETLFMTGGFQLVRRKFSRQAQSGMSITSHSPELWVGHMIRGKIDDSFIYLWSHGLQFNWHLSHWAVVHGKLHSHLQLLRNCKVQWIQDISKTNRFGVE